MNKSQDNTRIALNPRVRYRTVAGDGVMVQMDSSRVLVLNEVGLRVVELLSTPRSVDDLTDILVDEFDTDREQARSDLEHFLAQLQDEQVLQGYSPQEGGLVYQSRILSQVRRQRLLHEVTLELTYGCNLDCFFCYNDRDKPGVPLALSQYRTLLQDLARMQTLYLMLTGGEPMIHPHFFDIGKMARDLGFVVRVRTNGHSLGAAMSRRLREEVDPYLVEVSLHGATAEVHDRQTRVAGSFDRLVKNIAAGGHAGLRVSVVTTPTAWNEHQVDEMYALCETLQVPLRFQGPVAPRDNGDRAPLAIQPDPGTWQMIAERHAARGSADPSPAESGCGERGTAEEPAATCSVGVAGVDIDPYGNVQACMHLQESAGNLHEQSIEAIWRHAPLFNRARGRAIEAATQFDLIPVRQLGAPVYCLAVEENLNKAG